MSYANSVNPDPLSHFVASDLGMHCLPMSFLCPATKSGGVLCYPLRTFECLSVRQRLIIRVRFITLIPFEIISRNLAQI